MSVDVDRMAPAREAAAAARAYRDARVGVVRSPVPAAKPVVPEIVPVPTPSVPVRDEVVAPRKPRVFVSHHDSDPGEWMPFCVGPRFMQPGSNKPPLDFYDGTQSDRV